MEITDEGFIVVHITDEMRNRAEAKSSQMGTLRNSIRNGQGNVCGFLGEEVVLSAWKDAVSNNSFNHDIDLNGIRLEVKSKDRTVPPSLHYETSIANYNSTQTADFYVFVSLLRDKQSNQYTTGYIVGCIPQTEYKKKATPLKVGDIDPSNGWKVKASCYNLSHRKLTRFESLADS